MDDLLRTWRSALEVYRGAIEKHLSRVKATADLEVPGASDLVSSALAQTARQLGTESLGESRAGLEVLESALKSLDRAAAALADPRISAAARRGMSRTFSDEISREQKAIARAKKEAARLLGEAIAAVEAAPDSSLAVARFRAAPQSEIAAASLAGELRRGDGKAAGAMLDLALGVSPDSRDRIASDRKARRGMHPLQSLEVTFGLAPGSDVPPGEASAAGVILNQTISGGSAVRYSLGPLLETSRDTAVSGLNFRLVRRLNTIRAAPGQTQQTARLAEPVDRCGGGVVRTADGGRTFQALDAQRWDVGREGCSVRAGPTARVAALGRCLEDAVFTDAGPGVKTIRDPEALLEQFSGAAGDDPEFTARLARGLRQLDDSAAAASPREFMELLLDPGRIETAVAAEMKLSADQQIEQPAQLASRRTAARERMLTALVQSESTARAVAAKLRRTAEGTRRLGRELKQKPLRQVVASVVTSALAPRAKDDRRVEKLTAVGPRPTLKLHVLRLGDPTASQI